jgi:hypothetical protein
LNIRRLSGLRAADWQAAAVPGPAPAASPDGTSWYLCWVRVADSFFTKHDRNLFEESVGVNIRDLSGAHEVWVNGKRIGGGGSFPPDYRSGQDAIHRHKVPAGTLRKGGWNEIALRVHVPSGTPAFQGPAPFIMDYFVDGLNLASDAVQGHGGVWVMHTPYLLFYPDRNRDDIPDGPPEVRLAGFGFEDTHAVANGLVWGPGGQDITLTAREIKEVQPMGGSLMPEGLLSDLSPQQLRDFFAYLRISQPISSP